MESTFSFGGPQIDGSTKVMKDNKDTFCPRAAIVFIPNPRIANQVMMFHSTCFKECPAFQKAKRINTITNQEESGYAMMCMDRNIFVLIEESKPKPSLKLNR